MLKIGEFSKITRVPVATIRYYDERGLLRAVAVDDATGYRYYSINQLPRLNRILALKGLGFSLDQIALVLVEGVTLDQLRGMLRLRQAEIQQQLEAEQARLAEVAARLAQIEAENCLPAYDVVVKQVEPVLVGSVREFIPRFADIGRLFKELDMYLAASDTGCLRGAICYDEEYREGQVDAEAIIYLKKRVAQHGKLKVYELPGATTASVVHEGPYQGMSLAYQAVLTWIDRAGFRIAGPARDLYLQPEFSERDGHSLPITEIQIPIKKEREDVQ